MFLEVEILEDVLEDVEADGWMDGGCGPAGHLPDQWLWWGLQVAHGAGCREAEEEPRSGGRTTPGHTGSGGGPHGPAPSPTEPGATVARCHPHLPTTVQSPKNKQKKLKLCLRNKSHAVTRCFSDFFSTVQIVVKL